MNYLVIDGCTHRGNTWLVAEEAMNRLKETDSHCNFEIVHLMQANLPFCIGCSNCFRKGPEFCPHKTIMSDIISKINHADAVIFVSTTYNVRETALLKNFMDHTNYFLHRPAFFTKKALVITTVGGFGGKSTVKSIGGTLLGMGFNKFYGLSIATISWNAYCITAKHQKQIHHVTDKFRCDVMSGKMHFPKTTVLIPYNLFRGMSDNYLPGSMYETEDGSYYINRKRAYDKQIPLLPHQILLGNLFYLTGKVMGKKMIVSYKK